MNEESPKNLSAYLRSGESWAADRERNQRMTLRAAWITAAVLGLIALAEAVAIITLTPLKTVVPYTLLVDRQTGYVEALKPLDQRVIAPDKALTRSFLAQYIIAREGFDIDSLRDDYKKVTLWSAGDARDHYMASMQASNPASPLATLPRRALVEVEIRGLSSLSPTTSLVRFVTIQTDPGGQRQEPRPWQAVINYQFSAAAMSAADRLVNPLGFQVTRYRRDAEMPLSADVATPRPNAPTAGQMTPDAASPVYLRRAQ
jgi:type IV secretion system protein VirB8